MELEGIEVETASPGIVRWMSTRPLVTCDDYRMLADATDVVAKGLCPRTSWRMRTGRAPRVCGVRETASAFAQAAVAIPIAASYRTKAFARAAGSGGPSSFALYADTRHQKASWRPKFGADSNESAHESVLTIRSAARYHPHRTGMGQGAVALRRPENL